MVKFLMAIFLSSKIMIVHDYFIIVHYIYISYIPTSTHSILYTQWIEKFFFFGEIVFRQNDGDTAIRFRLRNITERTGPDPKAADRWRPDGTNDKLPPCTRRHPCNVARPATARTRKCIRSWTRPRYSCTGRSCTGTATSCTRPRLHGEKTELYNTRVQRGRGVRERHAWHTYTIVVVAQLEPVEAAALERSHGVETCSVVTHVRVTAAFVHVHARVAGRRQRVTVVADTLETPVQVRALAVSADALPFVTLVDVL